MPLINGEIPEQAFQKLARRVSEILADEFARQAEIHYNDADLDVTVWLERFIAFDHTQLPAINVSWNEGNVLNQHPGSSEGVYNIDIDCITKASGNDTEDGDGLSRMKCQRLMGLCRAILENPVYKTLGWDPPFIMHRRVTALGMVRMDREELKNISVGRVTLEVRVVETADLIDPNDLDGFRTTVILDESSDGYYWVTY